MYSHARALYAYHKSLSPPKVLCTHTHTLTHMYHYKPSYYFILLEESIADTVGVGVTDTVTRDVL